MMGSGYLIDHCLCQIRQEQKEKAYQAYCAECLRLVAENTAKIAGGSYLKARFTDLVEDIGNSGTTGAEKDPAEVRGNFLRHFRRELE